MEWILLAIAIVMVIACGIFVAAEFSFVTVDRTAVERAAAAGQRGAAGTVRGLKSLSTQLSGAQLGITLTNLAIGFLAEPSLAALLHTPLTGLGLPAGAVSPVALTIALVLSNVLTMVIGELVPKNLAIADPLRVALATSSFQRAFTHLMAWPIRLFNGLANALVRALGIEPQEELRSVRSPDEIASLVRRSADEGVLDDETASLVGRSLSFGDKTADDIMTPRVRMHTLKAGDPASAVLVAARATGHSRFPVVEADADSIIGAVHLKHALEIPYAHRNTTAVSSLLSAPILVPATLELDPLLSMLRESKLQLAIVVDEYGGTAGLVTLEDVVEEIVGDIADEHDRLDAQGRRLKGGSWSLSGLLRPDEVAELTGVALPVGPHYDTLAGLLLERFGSVPVVGDQVTVPLAPEFDLDSDEPIQRQVILTVDRLDGRRIDRVRLAVFDQHGLDQLAPSAGSER